MKIKNCKINTEQKESVPLYEITMEKDEALSICKVIGALSDEKIKKLVGNGYTCSIDEAKVCYRFFKLISADLLKDKKYEEIFMDKGEKQL